MSNESLFDTPQFQSLEEGEKAFLAALFKKHRFSFQEKKQLIEMAGDLTQWEEPGLETLHQDFPDIEDSRRRKEQVFTYIKNGFAALVDQPGDYEEFKGGVRPRKVPVALSESEPDKNILGRCPVASEKTRCCNLYTLDAAEGCPFGCAYCAIQTFYNQKEVHINARLAEHLSQLELDPEKNYHIGTGQGSDSLAFGNQGGILDALADFARAHENVILEMKTKAADVSWFLENPVPENMVLSWSLNPDTIVEKEEHGTAPLKSRLFAARKASDAGIPVGFHFHPIVRYKGWEEDYTDLAKDLQGLFSPREIVMISLGTLTYIKPVIRALKRRNIHTRILRMPFEEASGKYSYPLNVKRKLFSTVYNAFSDLWKEDVFFYLCMEPAELWMDLFGREYPDNEAFEADMFLSYKRKMRDIWENSRD